MNETGNGIRYRLESLERRLSNLEKRTENVNVHDREIFNLWTALKELGGEVGSLRRALYTAALSFAGGALLVAFTIFQVLGG